MVLRPPITASPSLRIPPPPPALLRSPHPRRSNTAVHASYCGVGMGRCGGKGVLGAFPLWALARSPFGSGPPCPAPPPRAHLAPVNVCGPMFLLTCAYVRACVCVYSRALLPAVVNPPCSPARCGWRRWVTFAPAAGTWPTSPRACSGWWRPAWGTPPCCVALGTCTSVWANPTPRWCCCQMCVPARRRRVGWGGGLPLPVPRCGSLR